MSDDTTPDLRLTRIEAMLLGVLMRDERAAHGRYQSEIAPIHEARGEAHADICARLGLPSDAIGTTHRLRSVDAQTVVVEPVPRATPSGLQAGAVSQASDDVAER